MKAVFPIVVVAIVIYTIVGTGQAVAQRKRLSPYAALADVPEKARDKKNPFESNPKALAAGGKLFEQHCAGCHGRKGGGARKGVSLLREEVQQATPGALFWILTNGVVRRGMPVWSKLPEPERWQIVTFLESLRLQPVKPLARDVGKGDPIP